MKSNLKASPDMRWEPHEKFTGKAARCSTKKRIGKSTEKHQNTEKTTSSEQNAESSTQEAIEC